MATCYVSILYNDVAVLALFSMILLVVLKKFVTDLGLALVISIVAMFLLLLVLGTPFMAMFTGMC